jgi:hypothetical protein
MIDLVVDRRELKQVIANALRFMGAVKASAPEPEPVAVESQPAQA